MIFQTGAGESQPSAGCEPVRDGRSQSAEPVPGSDGATPQHQRVAHPAELRRGGRRRCHSARRDGPAHGARAAASRRRPAHDDDATHPRHGPAGSLGSGHRRGAVRVGRHFAHLQPVPRLTLHLIEALSSKKKKRIQKKTNNDRNLFDNSHPVFFLFFLFFFTTLIIQKKREIYIIS